MNIIVETATSNMHHTVKIKFFDQRQTGFIRVAVSAVFHLNCSQIPNLSTYIIIHHFETNYEIKETINACHWKVILKVSLEQLYPRNHFTFFNNTYTKTRNIIFALGIKPAISAVSTANQRATRF
ncbi:MAG: hypothetical protein ACLRXQ_06840 [Phascolarctobacterium faecium]